MTTSTPTWPESVVRPTVGPTFLVHEHDVDAQSRPVKRDQLNFVNPVPAWCNPKHRWPPSSKTSRLFRRGEGAPCSVHVVEPRQRPFWREAQAKDHVHAKRFLCRIGVSAAGDRWSVWVGVQPVGEPPTPVATVASEQIVRPIFRQVVDGVRVPAVDHRGFADDEPLSSKQPVTVAFTCIGRFGLGLVRTLAVHVQSDQDFVRQRLQGPPHEVLQDGTGQVNLGRVGFTALQRFLVVAFHRFDEPCLDHRTRPDVAWTGHEPFHLTREGEPFKSSPHQRFPMARKRGGFSRFMGALTGTPYEKLLKQIAKLESDHEDDDAKLARRLGDLVEEVLAAYEEEEIDAEEHDLLMDAIEDADPDGRTFDRFEDDGDEFYDEDMPDAPEIKAGRRKNLDELMATTDDSFVGSFGREEFEEFRSKMTDEFIQDSDDAVKAGDHQAAVLSDARVFANAEEGVEDVKRQIALESGLNDPDAEPEPEPVQEEDDGGITVDEDGVEWYEDEEGSWWYRDPGEPDWVLYEE